MSTFRTVSAMLAHSFAEKLDLLPPSQKYHGLPLTVEPRTFNEKIQWLKHNYRVPLMVRCADKFAARGYVEECGLSELLIPLLGVWERAADIPFDTLPDRFALKCTHGAGWNVLCRDKSRLDRAATARKLDRWLRRNLYFIDGRREWVYKLIPPRVVAEQFIAAGNGEPPADVKIFCFHGEPRYIELVADRHLNQTISFYDTDWQRLPLTSKGLPDNAAPCPRPPALPLLLDAARRLSALFPFTRVDLYADDQRVWFGELTFYPANAKMQFTPPEWDARFGEHLDLRKIFSNFQTCRAQSA